MESVWIVLQQTVTMFLYMAIGALLFKKNLIMREGSRSLAHLLLYVVLPCVVVKSFCTERTSEKTLALLVSIAAAAVLLILAMAVAGALFPKDAVANFSAAFSNAGFMGFPLVTAMFGGEAVFYAAGFVALLNVLQWTYGQRLLSGNGEKGSLKEAVKNPLVLALAIGLILFFTGLPLPGIVSRGISSLAALNAPLAMIILGVYLAQTKIGALFGIPRLYWVSAVRLLLIPLLSLLLLKLMPEPFAEIRRVLYIVASAPVGSNVAVYAHKLDRDYPYAVQCVCLSTVLSILTLPLMILFMG